MNRAIALIGGSLLILATFTVSLTAKCPVSDGATLVVRAPIGDLQVDTTARDSSVDIQVDKSSIELEENCGKETVEFTSQEVDPTQIRSAVIWRIVAPKNTPPEIIEKLNKEINAALADPDIEARLADLGAVPLAGSPTDFGRFIAAEADKWSKVIRAANIKVE